METEIDLNSIPAKALNYSTRLLLGQYLNPEQQLISKDGFARDYRGLAEQMDFEYNEIRNFQLKDNPTLKMLDVWTSLPHTTIGQLVQYLENMGRHDVIQDLQPKFETDAKLHFQKSGKVSQESPLQVPEVTSCRLPDSRLDDSGILTREDANTGEYTLYDAFVCYADEDIHFVSELANFLESEVGFKLFIRSRDMLAGQSEYETSMQLIKERCKRVLIILSPDFLKCPACEVQASFAAGLGIDEKCRKLIPIIYKSCEIPLILKFISKIDFTKNTGMQDWIWDKLISSLQDCPSSSFISLERRHIQRNNFACVEAGPSSSSNPVIAYPPTVSSCALNTVASNAPSSTAVAEYVSYESDMKESKTTKQKKSQKMRFWKLQKKTDIQTDTSTPSTSGNSTTWLSKSATEWFSQ